jgi:hypothetical protein
VIAQNLLPWTNIAGLLLGMAGVVMIFIWGPPQPSFQIGVAIGLEEATPLPNGKTVGQQNRETESKRRFHVWTSRVGLGLIFLGFAFQLVASWPRGATH